MDIILIYVTIVCVVYLIFLTRQNISKLSIENVKQTGHNWGSVSLNVVDNLTHHFNSNVTYANAPSTIELNNSEQYKCTPNEPRPCKVSDQSSCFGCQNLTSRCLHVENDAEYIDTDGNIAILKKNEDADDGYCLSLNTLAQNCNPLHGKWVLVASEDQNDENLVYSLLCSCINPGYIGNTTLLGACDTPFVCSGKVKDIDTPLDAMVCECGSGKLPFTLNDIPTCQPEVVGNATSDRFPTIPNGVESNLYNTTIRGNYPGERIANPCSRCPLTNKEVFGYTVNDNDGGVQCVANVKYGLPIRRNPNFRLLKGDSGPDAVIAVSNYKLHLYGYLHDKDYPTMGVTFPKKGNEELVSVLELDKDTSSDDVTLLIEPYHKLKIPYNLLYDRIDVTPDIVLYTGWPRYKNYVENPVRTANAAKDYRTDYNVRLYQTHELAKGYAWNRESWSICQQQMKPLLKQVVRDSCVMFTPNKNLLTTNDEAKNLRFGYLTFDFPNRMMILNNLELTGDYLNYRNLFIKLGD